MSSRDAPEDRSAVIDRIREEIAPFVMHEDPLAVSMALCLTASHTVLHDGQTEEEFLEVARAAYRTSVVVHRHECKLT